MFQIIIIIIMHMYNISCVGGVQYLINIYKQQNAVIIDIYLMLQG
jgi:hypothetical protein